MAQQFETTLQQLQANLGSSHPIVALYNATCDFVANLLRQPFVPRSSAIRQLDNFVNSRNCGSVLVYAPAGFGKTTLLTRWGLGLLERKLGTWEQAKGDGDRVLVIHFFSRAPEFLGMASNPSIAFAHLLAQIFVIGEAQWIRQEFHPTIHPLQEGKSLDEPKFSPTQRLWEGESPDEPKFSIPETQNERASLLCETVANLKLREGKKLLILIDGIDEADEPFPSPFPDQLPEGVFVILSARWDGQSEMPYLRGWKFDEQVELTLMDEREIANWLECYGSGELKAMSKDEKLVATLKQRTDGLPLFLRFVLDELAEKVKFGETVSAFEVPKGFSAYIREQVQRIAASSWDGIPLMDLIALLSVAKGAIRQDEVAQVLNMSIEALSH
ncbi:MAG: ATP-binding protein, partial [Armatimonadetes bacterium]|nr:ATP-binding protein [Armatimonadota bacterium]